MRFLNFLNEEFDIGDKEHHKLLVRTIKAGSKAQKLTRARFSIENEIEKIQKTMKRLDIDEIRNVQGNEILQADEDAGDWVGNSMA